MEEALAILAAYLFGSVPFAFLLSQRRGIDLRVAGSGNVGATNVLRTSGLPAAVTAMTLDAVKGTIAVLVAQRLTTGAAAPVAAGLASIVGHVYPVWLRFHGGKGVATAAGVFAVLAPLAILAASGVFVAVVWGTRFISVGSVAAAMSLPLVSAWAGAPVVTTAGAAIAAALILHRHRDNLARVAAGTERRIGQRVEQT